MRIFLNLVLAASSVVATYVPKAPASRLFNSADYASFRRSSASYIEANMTMPVDHFNRSASAETFNVRYLFDNQYVIPGNESTTPIFLYTGNESPITDFYSVSGFMTTTLAQQFNAAVLFVEHRFYGTSIPGGDLQEALKAPTSQYFNVEQTFRDFIDVLNAFKTQNGLSGPVIAFGGSYGGMLAGWMRMKYPQHIWGALAASAPVRWFRETIDPGLYAYTSGQVIKDMGTQQCYDVINKGFWELNTLKYDEAWYPQVKTWFGVCDDAPAIDSPEVFQSVVDAVTDTVMGAAQTNYPEPNGDSPAWPVKAMCDKIIESVQNAPKQEVGDVMQFDTTNVAALAAGFLQAANPMNKPERCLKWGDFDPVGAAWTYQLCTELPMPQGQSVQTPFDFALPSFYQEGFAEMCNKTYGTTPNWNYALDVFGGRKPEVDFSSYSNIIFSNGEIDPWMNGGVLTDISANIKVIKIKQGAHHLDLRLPNDETDPAYVKDAREIETKHIAQWIKDWNRGYSGWTS